MNSSNPLCHVCVHYSHAQAALPSAEQTFVHKSMEVISESVVLRSSWLLVRQSLCVICRREGSQSTCSFVWQL